MYFPLFIGTWVWQTDVIRRSFKRRNGFFAVEVTLSISHLLQVAKDGAMRKPKK
jgi:hypothetical protein